MFTANDKGLHSESGCHIDDRKLLDKSGGLSSRSPTQRDTALAHTGTVIVQQRCLAKDNKTRQEKQTGKARARTNAATAISCHTE